jgi:hypothetical protein
MGLILSEPIKKVVEILKTLTKMSVEDAKNHPKRPDNKKKPEKMPAARRAHSHGRWTADGGKRGCVCKMLFINSTYDIYCCLISRT